MTRKEFFEALRKVLIEQGMRYHGPGGPCNPTVENLHDIDLYTKLADELGLKDPKTKVVYEWMLFANNKWFVSDGLFTEQEAADTLCNKHQKTGRSWEMLDEP